MYVDPLLGQMNTMSGSGRMRPPVGAIDRTRYFNPVSPMLPPAAVGQPGGAPATPVPAGPAGTPTFDLEQFARLGVPGNWTNGAYNPTLGNAWIQQMQNGGFTPAPAAPAPVTQTAPAPVQTAPATAPTTMGAGMQYGAPAPAQTAPVASMGGGMQASPNALAAAVAPGSQRYINPWVSGGRQGLTRRMGR